MYDPKKLATYDPFLTGFSVGFQNQELVGSRIAPITPVAVQSGRYFVFDRSNWLIYPDRREPGTEANTIQGRKWSTDQFFVKEHSLQAEVLDEEREELASSSSVDLPELDPERDAVEDTTNALLLRHEKKVADQVRDTANYAAGHVNTLVGAAQWSDYGQTSGVYNSNPVQNMRDALTKIYQDTLRQANFAWMSYEVAQTLRWHPAITARFQNFALDIPEAFRVLTGFNGTLMVAESVVNTADNVDAAENIQSLWGKDFGVAIVDPQPGQRTKTFIKTFVRPYNGDTRPTTRWRVESHFKDVFNVKYRYDTKIVSNVAGYIIKNAIA